METALFITGLIMFVLLIVLHELGHAIVARRNGVVVEEFGIGFPPKAWGKKLKNGVVFSLNWLPLGGFVKLKGEHDAAKGAGTYGGATLWVKTKILLAGVGVNWLTAAVIFTILALVGLPKVLPNQFAVASDNQIHVSDVRAVTIASDSPAQAAGIQPGDAILSFAGQQVTSSARFSELTASHAGQTVPFTFQRGDLTETIQVTLPQQRTPGGGFIGITAADQQTQQATWSAPIVGVGVTVQLTYEALKGLGGMVANLFQARFAEAGQGVAGPVGIFGFLQASSDMGLTPVLFLVGIISLSLAIMNTLPIPALDGGRLFVTLLFRVLKKPLTKEREESIQAAGFMGLIALIVIITIVDVGRLF